MKRLFGITLFLGVGLNMFVSCQSSSYDLLLRADSLINEYPDSAYKLLKSIDPSTLGGDKSQALYGLLFTQAQYKNYDSIKSDSLINIAVDYYSRFHESPYLDRVYIYKGTAMEDMGMWNEAMVWYKKAEDVIDPFDYAALGYINIRIADLYRRSYIENAEQINRYKKALKYYQKTTDTVKLDYLCSTIGRIYITKNIDSAEYYIHAANNIEYSKRSIFRKVVHSLQLQLMYYTKNDYEKSIYYGLLCLSYNPSKVNQKIVFNYLSQAYSNLYKLDSAVYYLNKKSYDINNIEGRYSCLRELVELEKCKGNYKLALEYNIEATHLGDSIRRESQKHNLFQIEKQFDKQRVEIENKELEYKSNIRLLVIVITFLALCIVVGLFFVVVSKYKRKALKHKELIDQLRNESIKSNNTLLEQLDKRNNTERVLKVALENRLQTVRELVELSYRFGAAPDSVFRSKFEAVLKTNDMYAGVLNDLKNIVNAKYFGLVDHMKGKYPKLSDKDLNLICLVCCNFSAIEMSVFFNYSNPKTIYSNKTRLCEKLFISTSLEDYLDREIEMLRARY